MQCLILSERLQHIGKAFDRCRAVRHQHLIRQRDKAQAAQVSAMTKCWIVGSFRKVCCALNCTTRLSGGCATRAGQQRFHLGSHLVRLRPLQSLEVRGELL